MSTIAVLENNDPDSFSPGLVVFPAVLFDRSFPALHFS